MKTPTPLAATSQTESFESLNSMIVLMETENAYLMQFDLPSMPVEIGEIVAKKNELKITTASDLNNALLPINLLSLRTIGGKIKSFYQGGALYVLLPKVTTTSLKTPVMG